MSTKIDFFIPYEKPQKLFSIFLFTLKFTPDKKSTTNSMTKLLYGILPLPLIVFQLLIANVSPTPMSCSHKQ